jgi:predicted ATP-grasp superfamily ATP-dependent carboligase
MATEETLIIVGASARAAAFSALRAGQRPWCLDLFADADLRARCPVTAIPASAYPRSLPKLMAAAPPGPWMYTGGLENHPTLVRRIAKDRMLLGNDADVLRLVRNPIFVSNLFQKAGLPHPDVRLNEPDDRRVWLTKPLASAGGAGIRIWKPGERISLRSYFQEFIDGPSCAAVFDDGRLLGVTEQLVGEPWLGAGRFRYCGSIGALTLSDPQRAAFTRLGEVLAEGCRLRGLFGIDFVWRNGLPLPVEVNPRYTASVEVLEYATRGIVGKAILFAKQTIEFPPDGPWMETLRHPGPVSEMPQFADIPAAGTPIAAGWPILTLFAQSNTAAECRNQLRRIAGELERWLYRT